MYPSNAIFRFLVLADTIFSDPHAAKIFFLTYDLGHFACSQLISVMALPSLLHQNTMPIFNVNDAEVHAQPTHCSLDVIWLHPVLVSL